ncbi:hypothetical protein BJX63DRAFT_434136 [Aspergillus granulosus]|uniref:L-ornithine N(5)-oxygenase n=1 Tax=Aspergillus granulosus TaxID=176169 RepID=A0ABR4H5B6_9EURO
MGKPGLARMRRAHQAINLTVQKERVGISSSDHLPGTAIQSYLKGFVEHFNLGDKIQLNTRVVSAELQNDCTWQIEAKVKGTKGTSGTNLRMRSAKLIVATGLSSTPSQPDFRGQKEFGKPCIHSKYFPHYEKQILHPTHNITVLGAGKSAWDIVYASATSGCTVDWIIRDTGHGPSWMLPPFITPWKRWRSENLSSIPLLWLVAPSIWTRYGLVSCLHRLVHSTAVGSWVISAVWSLVGLFILWMLGYDRHPEVKKLKPCVPLSQFVTSFGIFNYPTDFF